MAARRKNDHAQLKALRELSGLGYSEVGRRFGSVPQVIRKLEVTEERAALSTIVRFVEALGYEIEVTVRVPGEGVVTLDWSGYAEQARDAVLAATRP